MRTRNIIIACPLAEPTEHLTKFAATAEMWCVNDAWKTWRGLAPTTRIYQLHHPDDTKWGRKWYADWRRDYIRSGAQIVVSEYDPRLPKSIQRVFDYKRCDQEIVQGQIPTPTSSMVYALVEALWADDVSAVAIVGCKLQDEERQIAIPAVVDMCDRLLNAGVAINCTHLNKWRLTVARDVGLQRYAWPDHVRISTVDGYCPNTRSVDEIIADYRNDGL